MRTRITPNTDTFYTVCNKKYLKTKIKSYGDEITDFYHKEILRVDYNNTCLAILSLGSALKKDENFYS